MRTKNLKLFREMSVPYESIEAANAALQAFQDDLAELRKKHKIPTLLCLLHVTWLDDEDEGGAMTSCGFGDMQLFEVMSAWSLGEQAAERQQATAKLMLGKSIRKGAGK